MTLTRTAQIPSVSSLPPAYRAFFAGMDHLENSRPGHAATQFELAIAENPDFSEAYLLLAQSLMQADKLDQARIVLGQLLHADRARNDPYAEMTAMELMGQIDQKTGAIGPTLEWTRQAFENAETSGYICAAADLESRLIDVEKMLADSDAIIAEPGLAADAEPLPEFCGDMPPWLESGAVENCDWNVGAIAGLAGPAFGIASFGGSHFAPGRGSAHRVDFFRGSPGRSASSADSAVHGRV
jgi:tetratricopeptide (TPR) repeat protein